MNSNIKIEEWKKRLLDIGRTNKLINYKELRVGSLTIIEPGYKEIFESIYTKNNALEFVSRFNFDDGEDISENLEENTIVINKIQSEIKKSLDNLRLKNKKSLEEQGVNILHLAIGFLEWTDKDNRNIKSPLLLLPVKIEQGNIFESHKLSLAGDEAVLNPALQLKFESEYNITLRVPTEDDLADIDVYFDEIKNKLRGFDWIISDKVELGAFSFQKIAMYKDFDEIENEADHNNIVAAITGEDVIINSEEAVSSLETELDNVNPNDVFQILDADSSQQEAILAAKNGLSFVMQGPPGTGKSQTITNIIAECLAMGKSVLFVSEKLAALNVVYNKLKENGLDEFCLQLHSSKSNKKDVIRELADTLKLTKHNEKADYTASLNTLYALRKDLNDYVEELHKVTGPFGKSLYEVYGMLSKYSEAEDISFMYDDIDMLTEEKLNELDSLIERYSSLYKSVKHIEYKNVLKVDDLDEDEAKDTIKEIIEKLREKYDLTADINSRFNLNIGGSLDEFYDFSEIMEVLNRCTSDEFELLSVDGLESIPDLLKCLSLSYIKVKQLKDIIDLKYNEHAYGFDFSNVQNEVRSKEKEYMDFAEENKVKPQSINELLEFDEDDMRLSCSVIECADKLIKDINDNFNLKLKSSMSELEKRDRMFRLIIKNPAPNEKWFNSTTMKILENLIDDYKLKNNESSKLKDNLFVNFDKDILDIEAKEMLVRFRTSYSGGLKILKSNYRKDVKVIRGFYKGSDKLSDELIVSALQSCREIHETDLSINNIKEKLKVFLDDKFMDNYTDWDSIKDSVIIMKEINAELKLLNEEDNEDIKNILLSDKNVRKLADMEERIEYVLKNKQHTEEFSRYIFHEHDDFDNTEVLNHKLNKLLSYRECFKIINKDLSALIKDNQKIDFESLDDDIDKIKHIKELEEEIRIREAAINKIVPSKQVRCANLDELSKTASAAIRLKAEIEGRENRFENLKTLYNNRDFKEYASCNIENFKSLNDNLKTNIGKISGAILISENELNSYSADKLEVYFNNLLDIAGRINLLKDYDCVKESIDKSGMKSADIDELLERKSLEDIISSVNKRIISLWIRYQSNKFTLIRDFSKDAYELKVKKFKTSDKEQLEIAEDRLRHMLSENRPESNIFTTRNREVSLLLNEANKKRMHLPIRKLFSTIPDLLFKLKPCFLMSPLAVSSFLDINKIKFDVVVFDEASQICPEDAIGSMLRSKQVIIAGDSEQLPPTNFFTTSAVTDEFDEDAQEEHESILDKCSSIMPTVNLKWHYRSRHEDLISFSNRCIYKNLITIPSSQKRKENIGVEFIKVEDAHYERSGARVNRKEAEKVAELVFDHFRDFPDKSLGVVTFSESQSTAIDSALRKMRMNDKDFEEFFSEERKDSIFIKNIESVQGDERDVIIFSIGYGKDAYGNMSMNFGPLSRNGGYRRLNVAITRAKYNVKVVSSIEPSDIDLSRTKAEGVKMLKAYLEFAKIGFKEDEDVSSHVLESTVEKEIYNLLGNNGYDVDSYVGTSEYKINLAVKDPEDPKKYILAIELDGYTYSDNPTARERFRLREELLHSMGWKFYRIWSTEWIKDREKTESELLDYITAILEERAREREEAINNRSVESAINDEYIEDNSEYEPLEAEHVKDISEDEYIESEYEEVVAEPIHEAVEDSDSEEYVEHEAQEVHTEDASVYEHVEAVDESTQEPADEEQIEDISEDKYMEVIDQYKQELVEDEPVEVEEEDEHIDDLDADVYVEPVVQEITIEDTDEFGYEESLNEEESSDDEAKEEYSTTDTEDKNDEDLIVDEFAQYIINDEFEQIEFKEAENFNSAVYEDKNISKTSEGNKKNSSDIAVNEDEIAAKNVSTTESYDKKKLIQNIVNRECPIHIKYLCEQICLMDNLLKATMSYRNDVLKYISDNLKNIEIRDDEFLWIKGSKEAKLRAEMSYNRELKYICKEEIGLAIVKILRERKSLSKDELFEAVTVFFGEKYDSNINNRYLINAVDLLFEQKKIRLLSGKIELKIAEVYEKPTEEVNNISEIKISEAEEKDIDKTAVQSSDLVVEDLEDNPQSVKQTAKDFSIANLFEEQRFRSFRVFCKKNKIEKVTQVTEKHISDFRWATLINRNVLFEITERVKKYSDAQEKHISRECLKNDKFYEIKQKINENIDRLTDKQKLVANYFIDNMESIHEIENTTELGHILNVSPWTVSSAMLKLDLGSFSNFKDKMFTENN